MSSSSTPIQQKQHQPGLGLFSSSSSVSSSAKINPIHKSPTLLVNSSNSHNNSVSNSALVPPAAKALSHSNQRPVLNINNNKTSSSTPGSPPSLSSPYSTISSANHQNQVVGIMKGTSNNSRKNSMTGSSTAMINNNNNNSAVSGIGFKSVSANSNENTTNTIQKTAKESHLSPSSSSTQHKSWLEVRGATREHVHAAAANNAWIAKTTRQLQEAIDYVSTENGMMEEVLSEPHHIVSNNDLAAIMKSVLAAASDSKSSSIMQNRKPPVLRSIARSKGVMPSSSSTSKLPPDRSGTEYLPFASSAVPYAALQQEQRDMIQRNKERQAAYDRMILDVERQQLSFQESWGNLTK